MAVIGEAARIAMISFNSPRLSCASRQIGCLDVSVRRIVSSSYAIGSSLLQIASGDLS